MQAASAEMVSRAKQEWQTWHEGAETQIREAELQSAQAIQQAQREAEETLRAADEAALQVNT